MTEKPINYDDRAADTTASQAGVATSCIQTSVPHSLDDFQTRIRNEIDLLHEQLKHKDKDYGRALTLDLLDDPSKHELVYHAADYLHKLSSSPTWVDAALRNSEHLSRMTKIAKEGLPDYSFASPEAIDGSAKRLVSTQGDIGQRMGYLWSRRPWEKESKEGTFDGERSHAVNFGEANEIPATDFADRVLSRLSVHAEKALAELPDPYEFDSDQIKLRRDTLEALSMPKSRTFTTIRDSLKALYPVFDPRFVEERPIYTEIGLLNASLKVLESKVPKFSLKSTGSENLCGAYQSSLRTHAAGTEIHRCPKSIVNASREILARSSIPGPSEELSDDPVANRRRLLVSAMSAVKVGEEDPNALQTWEAQVYGCLYPGCTKVVDEDEESTVRGEEYDETVTVMDAMDQGGEQTPEPTHTSDSTVGGKVPRVRRKPRKLKMRGAGQRASVKAM